MADAQRFPHLFAPFAIAGGIAGWLSAGALAERHVGALPWTMQPLTAVYAIVLGALAGAVVRRSCIGARYRYELEPPNPDVRPPSDHPVWHVLAVLATGVLTGAAVGANFSAVRALIGAAGGLACAIVFVPVALAVVAAARRAQRARLGTLVASSDQRAVWSILAATLAATTLEALPEWWRSPLPYLASPLPLVALATAAGAALVVGTALAADAHAFRRVNAILVGLQSVEHAGDGGDGAPAEIDLGLGDHVGAHVAPAASAYRDRDRTLDLVRGDPVRVREAMRRARRRGLVGLALSLAMLLAHVVAAGVANV
jgi:hypothetical protein